MMMAFIFLANAQLRDISRAIVNNRPASYPTIINALVRESLYFSAIPYTKSYLTSHRGTMPKNIDQAIEKLIAQVGTGPFEVMNATSLRSSKTPIVFYILAKKYFNEKKYQEVTRTLNGTIPMNHPVKPFALQLEGSTAAISKRGGSAIAAFDTCVKYADDQLAKQNNKIVIDQLEMSRDYCIIGKARTYFNEGRYDQAQNAYLELSKSSIVWPEILFEEAWVSFYQGNYNQTLGKLATYKAPVFSYYLNPEAESLEALAYMELCLWGDVNRVVSDFYRKYEKNVQVLDQLIKSRGRNYNYFYLLAKSQSERTLSGNFLINKILENIAKDPTYKEMTAVLDMGVKELYRLQLMQPSTAINMLKGNVESGLVRQRELIGAYVIKVMNTYRSKITELLTGMSYIRLELLSQMKGKLYGEDVSGKKKGNVRNLNKTHKQYLWSFDGEFWADELGDYVYSLKSECTE